MSLAGQKAYEKIVDRLGNAIRNQRLSHAYIIEGDAFSGKENFAKEFAKAIICKEAPGLGCDNCRSCRMISEGTYRDFYYFTGDERSVKDKDIEELQTRISSLPMEEGGRNIVILEGSDTMTPRAQNRILKSLEEPYPGTVIILLAENSDRLLPTIKSRCQIIRLNNSGFAVNGEGDQFAKLAKTIIDLTGRKAYFFELKNAVEEVVNDRKSAILFLDALEIEFRNIMTKGESLSRCEEGIKQIEKARKEIRYNVREKYALGNLLLKIGG